MNRKTFQAILQKSVLLRPEVMEAVEKIAEITNVPPEAVINKIMMEGIARINESLQKLEDAEKIFYW